MQQSARGRPNAAPPAGRGGFDAQRPGAGRAVLRALGYLGGHRLDAAGTILALVLVSASNLAAPRLIQMAVDQGLGQRRADVVAQAVGGLVLLALLRGLFTFAQGYLAERASQGVAYDLRGALFTQIQRLSFSFYDQVQTGQLITRVTNDVEQVRTFAGTGLAQLAVSGFMFVGSAALLVSINWRLAIAALLAVVPIFWLLQRFVRRVGPLFGEVQQSLSRLNTILQEDLAGVRVIRAFVREPYEIRRYGDANARLLDRNLMTVRALASNFPLVFFFANLGTVVVIGYGGIEAMGGRLSIGELIAFNSYLGFLLQPMLTIGFLAAGISRAGASALRIFDVLDAPLDIHDRPDAVPLPPITGRVEFSNVSFRYPGADQDVLRGVSFTVEPGQTVALLGTTGSGKSSLVNLLPRFYDVTGGSVSIDGHDVRSVTLASLRSQVGIVLQDAILFSGTVADNIAYGRPSASREQVEAAARAAQADEFIRGLPNGYDSLVGERGVGLSGGQRQRLSIARALLVDPPLLILDDSTSAVDVETETALQEALDQLMRARNHTALVIAQRISTVRDADLILVLDQGVIAASGTHEELLRESEIYHEILGSQLREDLVPSIEGATVADAKV